MKLRENVNNAVGLGTVLSLRFLVFRMMSQDGYF